MKNKLQEERREMQPEQRMEDVDQPMRTEPGKCSTIGEGANVV